MRLTDRLAATVAPTVNAGLWAVVFLQDRTGPALLVVPVVMAAVAMSLRHPAMGVLLLGAAQILAWRVGLAYGSLELVAGSMIVLGWAGRYCPTAWPGLLGVALCAVPSAMRDGFELRKVVVVALVFGFVWVFGRLVRQRALAATAAVEEAERLATASPSDLAHPQTRAERRRIADTSAANLRRAVQEMIGGIEAILASTSPPRPEDVRGVRERGARTVEELRRLLLLLRDEPQPVAPVPPPPPRRGLHVDLALAGVAAVLTTVGLWWDDGWATGGWTPLAYAGLVTSLAMRTTAPLVAGVVLASAMTPLVLAPPTDPDALLPLAGGIAAVVWVLVDHPGPRTTAVGVVLAGSAIALGTRFGFDGVAFICVVLLIATASGMAWGEPQRILIRARERSTVLREALQAAAAEAVRQERLRIARDLHDSTSHAVGVMLMQLSAAEANLATAPEKALTALATAKEAGAQAQTSSSSLLPSVHTPLTSPDLEARAGVIVAATALCTELRALVDLWRRCGMAVTATIEPPSLLPPDLAVTCYRIVQESLTNCARHAPGGRVHVRVVTRRRQLLVEVEDTGPSAAVSSSPSGRIGLAGLRERVVASQGQFTAGAHGPGFRVSARFALPTSSRSSR